jgi:hypothetical protein
MTPLWPRTRILFLRGPFTMDRHSIILLIPNRTFLAHSRFSLASASFPFSCFWVTAAPDRFTFYTVTCPTDRPTDRPTAALQLLSPRNGKVHRPYQNSVWMSCHYFHYHISINPLTPELNHSPQRCLTRISLGILLLEPSISLIYAWKTNKCNI